MTDAAQRFSALVNGTEAEMPLDTGCLLIAAGVRDDGDPDGVVSGGAEALDRLADECASPSLEAVRNHLFGTIGLAGNRQAYEDPRNSYLDDVLRRRTGIPITLSVVVMEVGRRLGLELTGVGMPGHFLVGAGRGWYLDAFDGGVLLDEAGCRSRFAEVAGPAAPWHRGLLAPAGTLAVLARVLANLRGVLAATGDLSGLARVLELRTAIPGVPAAERSERSAVLAALGRYDEAADELDVLAAAEAGDADGLRSSAAALRARLN